jgi:ABC-type phosphate transport system permease subunit
MSRNEIRLRRQRLTARGTERFRNYGAVLERHEQEKKIKKVVRVFTLLFVILILVMLIVIVVRLEKRASQSTTSSFKPYGSTILKISHHT